ncbi:hypothetical protein SPBRAN_3 [uncultured Candidatus Thioglobus sp.]|nr:hypothetical protein SPBRAN_3 [uncultured Candidatus Thioglobus sp.]
METFPKIRVNVGLASEGTMFIRLTILSFCLVFACSGYGNQNGNQKLNQLISAYSDGSYTLLSDENIDPKSCQGYIDYGYSPKTNVSLDLNFDGTHDFGVFLISKPEMVDEKRFKRKLDFVVFLSNSAKEFDAHLIERFDYIETLFDMLQSFSIFLHIKDKNKTKFRRVYCERSEMEIFWLDGQLETNYLSD